jgi:glycosyltransferase involved in cell wall biosynthesis
MTDPRMKINRTRTTDGTGPVPSPSLSLIIAVYNKPDFLEKIFLSLQNQTMKNFEIVVADDGSGPEISDVITRYAPSFPLPIRHVRHDNKGFRKTVIANKAVTAASAEYLVFIDGDCVLHHRFLESHFRHRRMRTVLAGRRVMLDKGITDRLTNEDVASRRIERPWFWWRHCLRPSDRKHGLFVPGLFFAEHVLKKNYSFYGSNFSVFKKDYLAVNGYDERIIGRGIEDDNLRERLKLSGVTIRSVTREALQYHLYHLSSPVPHDPQTIREFCYPEKAWVDEGLRQKSGKPDL